MVSLTAPSAKVKRRASGILDVEEKFGEQNFRVLRETKFRKIVYIDPKTYTFRRNFENWKTKWDKNSVKI